MPKTKDKTPEPRTPILRFFAAIESVNADLFLDIRKLQNGGHIETLMGLAKAWLRKAKIKGIVTPEGEQRIVDEIECSILNDEEWAQRERKLFAYESSAEIVQAVLAKIKSKTSKRFEYLFSIIDQKDDPRVKNGKPKK